MLLTMALQITIQQLLRTDDRSWALTSREAL